MQCVTNIDWYKVFVLGSVSMCFKYSAALNSVFGACSVRFCLSRTDAALTIVVDLRYSGRGCQRIYQL